MCPAPRLFDSASPGRPCCLAKAKVRPKHIAGFLVPRPRMRPQWTRQTTGLHGPASTDTPASDTPLEKRVSFKSALTPRSAPSGLSARDRRRCREQRWDKPGIDESHRQAGLVSVWWGRTGMGRERISRTANRWRGYPPLGEVCPSPPAPRLQYGAWRASKQCGSG